MKVESNREEVKENCFKKKNTEGRVMQVGSMFSPAPRFHLPKDSVCVHQHIGYLLLCARCCAEICSISSKNPPTHTMRWVMTFPLEKGHGSSNWETNQPWLYMASRGRCSDFKPGLSGDKPRALNHLALHEKLTDRYYIPFGKQGSLLGSWLRREVDQAYSFISKYLVWTHSTPTLLSIKWIFPLEVELPQHPKIFWSPHWPLVWPLGLPLC